ncbi:MAG: porin family protein [Gammaproteobacteria bacterium]
MKFKQTKLAVAIGTAAVAMAGALVAPQAVAHSSVERMAQANDAKVRALEAQMQQMREMMSQMQSELSAAKMASAQQDPKVQELDDWMQSVKSAPVKEDTKDNMVFFRGGFAKNDRSRHGVSIQSNVVPIIAQDESSNDGWYIGAGFDFSLDDNLWGLMDNTEVLAELMFEYKEFGAHVQGNALASDPSPLADPTKNNPRSVTVNQFTLTAAPKIKFLKGSSFRPWIIPFGLGLHVISPPSESITVLNPGMMFGGGADYKLWKDIYVGADARYHLTAGAADGVNTDGFTAGGYLGIGF